MSATSDTAYTDGLPDDNLSNAFARAQRGRRPRTDKSAAPSVPQTDAGPAADDTAAVVPDVVVPAPEPVQAAAPRQAEPEQAPRGPAADDTAAAVPEQRDQVPAAEPSHREVAVRPPAEPEPVQAVVRPLPAATGTGEERTTQCTINVSVSVRDRFAAYQTARRVKTGTEPTNAVVVRWAVLHAHRNGLWGQMLEYVRHSQTPVFEEDDDPDGLFGDVPASRQTVRGRARDTVQQSLRPSLAELARYDQLAAQHQFGNRSEFLDAALEMYLPAENRRR